MNTKKIIFFSLGLCFFNLIHCMKQEPNLILDHVNIYIGSHAYTSDYQFQEALRKNDLGIKNSLEKFLGKEYSEKFFINGWGQIIGALIALDNYKISNELNNVLNENIEIAIKKGNNKNNPFINVNVREQAKNIMMYPHQGQYLPWQKVAITKPITLLNNLLTKYPAKFSLTEGKCYLNIGENIENTIFTELWESDFAELLEKEHYYSLQANNEHPHITLINSNVIATIKDKFNEKYQSEGDLKFTFFMNSWLNIANEELKNSLIEFTQLDSTYSEDYSPFEEVVVARLKAPIVQQMLKMLSNKINEEVGYIFPVKNEDSFHLTLATKYREPNDFSFNSSVEEIINSCSKETNELLKFFKEFQK